MLTPSSFTQTILKKRYLMTDANGKLLETPREMFWRVSCAVAKADASYGNLNLEKTAKKFFNLMTTFSFLPAGRMLFEAGNPHGTGQLSSCFVLPINDSIASIFKTLGEAAVIQKNNGGTGFNFSKIRMRGDKVKGVLQAASGPVDFLFAYDQALGAILQGAKRKGANIAILNCDHPDVLEFINIKEKDGVLPNFNISVGITDKFMKAVVEDKKWSLINPRNKEVVKKLSAQKLFEMITQAAWKRGEPGILFLDRINADNTTPFLGKIEATNPCGELPLLPHESCNLGSIVLVNHLKNKNIDWPKLEKTTRAAVHFLDNVIDINCHPLEKIEKMVKFGNRKIGLGVMGYAHLLFKLGIPYGSPESLELLARIMKFIRQVAEDESFNLAKKRGSFPNFDQSVFKDKRPRRNASLLSIAPTGTISLIAETSSGIEPVFSLVSKRRAFYEKGKSEIEIVDPVFLNMLKKYKSVNVKKVVRKVAQEGSIVNVKELPKEIREVFVCAHDIPWKEHVLTQATAQKHVDNSVSKTINFNSDTESEEIRKAFLLAWKEGCKGITVYRDKSKRDQVIEKTRINGRTIPEDERTVCPECGNTLVQKEGCVNCSSCGFSYCKT